MEREVRAFLECGVLAHGFIRVHCDACGRDRLVAFRCKSRGFCANQRLRARKLLGIREGQCGSVTFIQRFGSALNLAPHFHRLKTPWRNGTTHVVMERRELLERLAPLIPPPRAHQVRYHGVLAPCASGRDQVVPVGPEVTQAEPATSASSESDLVETGSVNGVAHDEAPGVQAVPALRADRNDSLARRIAGADMLRRVFEVDALRYPACGGRMRLVVAITDARVAARILECLALPPRAPPLVTAKEVDLGPGISNRALESKLNQALEDPAFEFNQTAADERPSNEGA